MINKQLKELKEKGESESLITKFINDFTNKNQETDNLEDLEKQQQQNIESLVIVQTLFSFISVRLKDFMSKKTYIAVFFLKTVTAFLASWFLISLLNYTIYKMSFDNFTVLDAPIFFDFIYYSFHSMFLSGVADITPVDWLSKSMNVLAPIINLIVTGTLISVFYSIKTEEYKTSLQEIIDFSNNQLEQLEEILSKVHNMSKSEVFAYLKKKKSYVTYIVKEINEID